MGFEYLPGNLENLDLPKSNDLFVVYNLAFGQANNSCFDINTKPSQYLVS